MSASSVAWESVQWPDGSKYVNASANFLLEGYLFCVCLVGGLLSDYDKFHSVYSQLLQIRRTCERRALPFEGRLYLQEWRQISRGVSR